MPKLIEVSADDLAAVTDAVLSHWHESYTLGSGTEVHQCRFCGKDQDYDFARNKVQKPSHELTCPVLIAKSIKP